MRPRGYRRVQIPTLESGCQHALHRHDLNQQRHNHSRNSVADHRRLPAPACQCGQHKGDGVCQEAAGGLHADAWLHVETQLPYRLSKNLEFGARPSCKELEAQKRERVDS